MFRTPERLTPRQKQRRKILARALRSGKYQRAEGYLCDGGKFCPQGVAIEEARKHGWVEGEWVPYSMDVKRFVLHNTEAREGVWDMPPTVAEVYGFTMDDLSDIVQLNDTHKVGFTVIASGIERDDLKALEEEYNGYDTEDDF
jgi:hypothetical protein